MRSKLCVAGVAAVLGLMAPAQNAEGQLPAKRAHHAIVYDSARGRVLLSGGSSPYANGDCCAFFNDLWSFDGARWTALPSSGASMSGMRLVFDARRGRVLSFGGYANRQSLGDIRLLENDTWKSLGVHPEMVMAEGEVVFDPIRDRFIAFGGTAGYGRVNGDTWVMDSLGAWKKLAGQSPPPRASFAMVYDQKRGRTVMFGGTPASGPSPQPLADIWELVGDQWTRVDTGSGPGARHSMGVAYDSRRGAMIIFGGMTASGFVGDTWSWDGRSWRKLADASPDGPPARAMGYLAYDSRRDRVVLFGGRLGWPNDVNDTWEWDGTRWHQVR